jgi:hypothetical protein
MLNAYDFGIRPCRTPEQNSARLLLAQQSVITSPDPTTNPAVVTPPNTPCPTETNTTKGIYFPAHKDPYTFAYGLRVASDMTFIGDGPGATHLRCTRGDNFVAPFPSASVFVLGNFSQRDLPRMWNLGKLKPVTDIVNIPTYSVKLVNATDATSFQPGDIVVITSTEWTPLPVLTSGQPYELPVGFSFQVTNEVERINGQDITLKYRIDHQALGVNVVGGTPKRIHIGKIPNVNEAPTFWGNGNSKGTWPNNTPYFAFASKNVVIRDMSLSASASQGFGFAFDNMVNCHFDNLYIDARSIVYGNGANYSTFQNIRGRFKDFFSDCKAGAYKSEYRDIDVTFMPDPLFVVKPAGATTPPAGKQFLDSVFSIGEATRAITVNNVRIRAQGHPGGMPIQGEDHKFNNFEIESTMTSQLLRFPKTQEGYPTKNIRFHSCRFVVPSPTNFITMVNSPVDVVIADLPPVPSGSPVGTITGTGRIVLPTVNVPERITFDSCIFDGVGTNRAVWVISPAKEFYFIKNIVRGGNVDLEPGTQDCRIAFNRANVLINGTNQTSTAFQNYS